MQDTPYSWEEFLLSRVVREVCSVLKTFLFSRFSSGQFTTVLRLNNFVFYPQSDIVMIWALFMGPECLGKKRTMLHFCVANGRRCQLLNRRSQVLLAAGGRFVVLWFGGCVFDPCLGC